MRSDDPWRVLSSGEYGRYLVASRDISPGELVLTDQALVWGPQHSATNLLCLECLVDLTEDFGCQHCGYPLCPQHREVHPTHEAECEVFRRNGHRLTAEDRQDMDLHYPAVEMVRCLVLMESSQEIRTKLEMLMDHGKERMAEPEKYIAPYKDLIRKLVRDLKLGTEEEIIKVIGYFDVNSLAVRGDCGSYKGRGIYPLASLVNHSCVTNTRNIMTGEDIVPHIGSLCSWQVVVWSAGPRWRYWPVRPSPLTTCRPCWTSPPGGPGSRRNGSSPAAVSGVRQAAGQYSDRRNVTLFRCYNCLISSS